jgi:hypothetical protein
MNIESASQGLRGLFKGKKNVQKHSDMKKVSLSDMRALKEVKVNELSVTLVKNDGSFIDLNRDTFETTLNSLLIDGLLTSKKTERLTIGEVKQIIQKVFEGVHETEPFIKDTKHKETRFSDMKKFREFIAPSSLFVTGIATGITLGAAAPSLLIPLSAATASVSVTAKRDAAKLISEIYARENCFSADKIIFSYSFCGDRIKVDAKSNTLTSKPEIPGFNMSFTIYSNSPKAELLDSAKRDGIGRVKYTFINEGKVENSVLRRDLDFSYKQKQSYDFNLERFKKEIKDNFEDGERGLIETDSFQASLDDLIEQLTSDKNPSNPFKEGHTSTINPMHK